MSKSETKIAFIGAGNMASAIIGGLLQAGFEADRIIAADPLADNLARLHSTHGIATSQDNHEAIKSADVVVLAVKPQIMEKVCTELKPSLNDNAVVMSIAAGVTCANLEQWLGNDCAIVRSMPNTPAQVSAGASGLYANKKVTEQQKQETEQILGAVGITRWVKDEDLIDTVTAISGSAPAYFFLFIESMIDAAVSQGMDKQTATDLAIQSALGAAKLAQASEDDVAELRRKVTSPKGTTERAIEVFEEKDLRSCVNDAMAACAQRAKELAS